MPLLPRSATSRQNDYTKFNFNHFALIKSTAHNSYVVGRLPEEIPLTISSEWEAPLSGAFGALKTKAVDFVLRETTGLTLKNQLFTSQIWSGSSPIEMTVPLEFYAEEDPYKEVIKPIIELAKMALPRYNKTPEKILEEQGLLNYIKIDGKDFPLKPLTAPGPLVFEAETRYVKSDEISIQLGNFMVFSGVIVTNINVNFNTRDITVQGKPLRASCEVTFRTIQSLTGEDLLGMFIN